MIKTVGIYKNIQNPKEFEEYYISKVMPRLLQFPGVIRMKITSLKSISNQQPEGMEEIQLIIETYYQSQDTIEELLSTTEGREIIRLITNNPEGELGSYFGKEKIFSLAKPTDGFEHSNRT